LNAKLIIVGTKGESSLKRILYGNVTSNVILESDIPVFTVPANSKKPYLDRFIFATDFRDGDLDSLQRTVDFARPFNAEIHVLHIEESNGIDSEIKFRGFCDLVQEKIDYENLMFKNIKSERFSKGISEYLKDHPVSLLIITRYKKAFLKTLLWANTTQELTYHTTVPMLVQIPK
ncbi:MAG: universal stress protein, partial [Balneolaceae bacterium]|nr:universal stress protein [Balneolaceae bacterium]